MEEIRNKVNESGLIQMDLAKYKPKEQLVGIDVSEQLLEGLLLREKLFRQWIKENDWSIYSNKAVFLYCSTDAIVPAWAYMLIVSKLLEINVKAIVGNELELEKFLIFQAINKEELTPFIDGKIIVKGCSDIHAIEFAMSAFVSHFQTVASSIMFGEPCSTVPVYKRPKVSKN